MFNIFLCFSVFYIHAKLISPQYMPGDHTGQSCEKGLRANRETYPPKFFPALKPFLPMNKRNWRKISPPSFFQAFLSDAANLLGTTSFSS
jgi:hypothetical protein